MIFRKLNIYICEFKSLGIKNSLDFLFNPKKSFIFVKS